VIGTSLDRLETSIAGLFAFASQSHGRALALIALLACAITLPGLQSMPVTDRDEARYVQASKQMMETGDYIDIRNLDKPRWKKPAGIYWLQVASAKTLGSGAASKIWAYRVPSALGIIIAAMLTYWALIPLIGRTPALIGGLMTASTATTAVEDQDRPERFTRIHALLWIGVGLGFLVKGPIILIPFLGALLWLIIAERSIGMLRAISPLKGLALFALIAAPWYIAIAVKTDGAFFAESLGKDLLGKVGNASENHGGPFGYYLASMWITFWPWAPLALLALPFAWANRGSDTLRLFAAWIIPCWAVFALTTTKLPHYILPLLPALAGLIGMTLTGQSPRWLRILASFLFVIGSMAAGFFAIGPLPILEDRIPLPLILASVLILATFFLATLALITGRKHAFAALGVATLLVMFPTLTTDTRFISIDQTATLLSESPKGQRVFVRLEDQEDTVAKLTAASGQTLEQLTLTTGLNYNSGKSVKIAQIAIKDDPTLKSCQTE